MRLVAGSPLVLAQVLASALAAAQGAPPARTGGGASTAAGTGTVTLTPPAAAGTGQGATGAPPPGGPSAAPAASDAAEKAGPSVPMAGYAYSDKPAKRPAGQEGPAKTARVVHRSTGPVVSLPGFEQLPDGGSRLFVQLSQSVQVEERKAQGQLTYILKGASARVRNNTNALVTIHFNTPVARARLVPQGNDLHFVVELRAAVAPTWRMADAPDKSAMLTIDFAKGNFGGGDGAEPPNAPRPEGGPRGDKPKAPAPGKPGDERPAPGPNP
jgi:hypothetical protein